ncbi:MAG: Arm DNA-binding domain-containing protein, partial [Robiginitalea sp.]
MSESFSVRFSARKSRSNYDPDLSIYVRITVNGKRAEISLQRKISKVSWNPISGR